MWDFKLKKKIAALKLCHFGCFWRSEKSIPYFITTVHSSNTPFMLFPNCSNKGCNTSDFVIVLIIADDLLVDINGIVSYLRDLRRFIPLKSDSAGIAYTGCVSKIGENCGA